MMDFLDPRKSRAATVRLLVGYFLMAVALILATYVLLNLASGYGVQQGKVIQNGLVFVSSNPSGASIYLNGRLHDERSNARLILPSGTYTMSLSKSGYRDWQRALTVEGGSVEHFDYPLLIPKQLSPNAVSGYAAVPNLMTESPDRRWLIVQTAGQMTSYDVYDLRNSKEVLANKKSITVPAAVFSLPQTGGAQSLKAVEWSRDNDHLLMIHTADSQTEYIMISRSKPEESFNVTKKLQLNATTEVSLQDKKFDRYFLHDKSTQTLSTATFNDVTPKPLLSGVLAYKSYGQDVVVYATKSGADDGKVEVKLHQDKQSYLIRQVNQDTTYLLDLTTYDGDWYIAAGTPSEDHVYIYKNPIERLKRNNDLPLVPVENLKLVSPNYIEFSANSQYLLAENGQDIATYDAENERSYTYRIDKPIDAPQTHVTWMDGYHLAVVSGGAVTIFDYDGTNMQTLGNGLSIFLPFFDTSYKYQYAIAPAGSVDKASGVNSLFQTPLRLEQDL
jgi:hypothetical protein